MSLDTKEKNKIKAELRGGRSLTDILKNLPDLFDLEKKETKPKLSPEQYDELRENGKDFLEKLKKKKKIIPKIKPDPDRPPVENLPFYIDPNKPMPEQGPAKPYIMRPDDKYKDIRQLLLEAKKNPNKKGGMVKGYKAGGQVKKDKSPNSGMITKRGWGASRKT